MKSRTKPLTKLDKKVLWIRYEKTWSRTGIELVFVEPKTVTHQSLHPPSHKARPQAVIFKPYIYHTYTTHVCQIYGSALSDPYI